MESPVTNNPRRQILHHPIRIQARSDLIFPSKLVWLLASTSTLVSSTSVVLPTYVPTISNCEHESFISSRWPCAGFTEPEVLSGCKILSARSQQLRCPACDQRRHLHVQEEGRQDRERSQLCPGCSAPSGPPFPIDSDASRSCCVFADPRSITCS